MLWYLCVLVMGVQMECYSPPMTSFDECKAARDGLAAQIELERTRPARKPQIVGCFGTPQAFPAPSEERGA